MRRLPTNQNENQKAIIEATRDFYGDDTCLMHIAIELMGRKRGNKELSEQDRADMRYIQANLADPVYRANLMF